MGDDALRGPYSAPIRYGDRTYHVRSRTDMADNPEFQAVVALVTAVGDREEQQRLHCRGVAHVVAAWDLVADDGRWIPIAAEAIGMLPAAAGRVTRGSSG